METLSKWLSRLVTKVTVKKVKEDSEPKTVSPRLTMSYSQMLERAYKKIVPSKEQLKERSAELAKKMEDEEKESIREIETALLYL